MVLGGRGARRGRLRRDIRHRRRQQHPADDRRDRLLRGDSRAPTPRGEFNPWHERLDRHRWGSSVTRAPRASHSMSGTSIRGIDAIVAWDPAVPQPRGRDTARSDDDPGRRLQPPRRARAARREARGARPTGVHLLRHDSRRRRRCHAGRAAGDDHLEWTRLRTQPLGRRSIYGEMVATYYTLAWLDRYLRPSTGSDPRGRTRCGASPPAAPTASIGLPTCTRSASAVRRRRGASEREPRGRQRADHHRWAARPEPAVVPVRVPLLPQRGCAALRRHANPLPVTGGRP